MRQPVLGVTFLLFCAVEAFSQSPVISTSPASFSFNAVQSGSLPASQKLHITNTGGGALNWSAFRARNSGWLSLVPTSGTAPDSITVSITTTGLTPNTYVDTLIIYSAAANPPAVYVPVTYTVSAPPQPAVISLSPSVLAFTAYQSGPLPASQKLHITNTGGGALNWSAFRARNSGWLSLVPTFGTAPDSVTVSITTTGLMPSTYHDTIVVSSLDANNSPQRVPVSYTVSVAPTSAVISLSPSVLAFTAYQSGPLPASQNLQITNTGEGALNWSAFRARNSGWLDLVPTSGTAPGSISVSITTTGLTPNTYYDTILVFSANASNSPQTVPVIYTMLENIPTDVEDGSANRPRTFTLFQNYPNPFNPTTKIDFALPHAGHTTLEIFNVVGQRIRMLMDGELSAGLHSVVWDGREASGNVVGSGIYFYRLKSQSFTDIKRAVFLK